MELPTALLRPSSKNKKKTLFPRAPLIFEEMELSSSKIKKSAKVLQNIGPRNIEWQLKSLMPNKGVIK